MAGFTKLCSCITSSSIWNEDDKTRIVWITMLAMCEPSGIVPASVGGLAHVARVSREDCEAALKILESPDADSRSPEHDGRRIQRVNGGFLLLNYGKYREARSDDERRAYMREYMKGYRKTSVNKRKQPLAEVNHSKPLLAKEEAEEEGEEETNTGTLVLVPPTAWTPNDEQRRLNSLFNRRDTTKWSKSELAAWKAITPIADEDFRQIERYYKARIPVSTDFRRRDLCTLLNNWNGEVDRARLFKAPSIF